MGEVTFEADCHTLTHAAGVCAKVAAKNRLLGWVRWHLADNTLTMTADNLDQRVEVRNPVLGDGVSVFTPAAMTLIYLKGLPDGRIKVAVGDDMVELTSGRATAILPTIPLANAAWRDLAPLPPVGTIQAAVLADAIERVMRAASGDDSRPVLTGVQFAPVDGRVQLVATDSYRLHVVRSKIDEALFAAPVLIPASALAALDGFIEGEVTFGLTELDAEFTSGTITFRTRLISGDYPNWQSLSRTDDPGTTAVVPVAGMLAALKRMLMMGSPTWSGVPVQVTFDPDASTVYLQISQRDSQSALSDEVEATISGNTLTVGFNPAYFADLLDAIPGDEAQLVLRGPTLPVEASCPGDDSFTGILMPVRVS